MSDVKSRGSAPEVRRKPVRWRPGRESGTHGVAVKCVDIVWNTGSEGETLERI